MLTVIVFLAAVALVIAAGEAVRGQCRRMLDRPIPLAAANMVPVLETSPDVQPAHATVG